MKQFSITTTKEITREQVANLLTSAFEDGSNYWYRIEKFQKPGRFEFYTMPGIQGEDPAYPRV